MSFQNLQQEWTKHFNETISDITDSLTTKFSDDADFSAFRALARWLTNTSYNSYEFMPEGYQGYLTNPFETNHVLNTLHHALIDDGDVSFVKLIHNEEVLRVFMVFAWHKDDYFQKLCLKENETIINVMITGAHSFNRTITSIHEKNPNTKHIPLRKTPELEDFKFIAHRNPLQFIQEVEEYQTAHKQKMLALDEKLRVLRKKTI